MREGPPDEVLSGACKWGCRVSSWLGGTLLAATIPVIAGTVTAKVDDDVQCSLSIQVPRFASPDDASPVQDWKPSAATDPLARYGQQLDVTIIVESVVTGEVWETRVGRFVIQQWDDDDQGTIIVKADGTLSLARDEQIPAPISPTGTLVTEASRVAPDGVGVDFDNSLVDRDCPTSMSWSDSPLGALQEIADAWPALLRTNEWGEIVFKAPLAAVPEPVITLTDGEGGTLVLSPTQDTRKDAYNQVIASSSNADSEDVYGVAQLTDGPMSVTGNYGVVSKKWSSPLLGTRAEAQAAAATMLTNSTRPALSIPLQIAPDPRIDLDDAIEVKRNGQTLAWGWVVGYTLPLTADGGAMRVDLGVAL